jgi:hypothetical protein
MQNVIEALRDLVPNAFRRGQTKDVVPLPDWWDGPNLDHPGHAIQIGGMVQDVNSLEPPFSQSASEDDEAGRVFAPPAQITGAWDADLDREAGFKPPPGWKESGVEALAWYSSFHYCFYAWGIFVRSSGIEKVAAALVANAGCSTNEAFRAAWTFLYEHELTHFRTDILITGIEFASRQALFIAGRDRQHLSPDLGLPEEALANAVARDALPPNLRSALNPWLDQCPPGYRDWRQHTQAGRQASWNRVLGEAAQGEALPLGWTPLSGRPPHEAQVPVFLIVDSPLSAADFALAFVGPIGQIQETDVFVADLRRLGKGDPRVLGLWAKRKQGLADGTLAAGSHLEQIDGRRGRYSVRIDGKRRVGLEHNGTGLWRAIAADQHDALYARLRRMP